MVRLIPIEERGKTVWVEDAPDTCPAGHDAFQRPGWGPCEACGWMVRVWDCQEPGCGARSYDDKHVCRR